MGACSSSEPRLGAEATAEKELDLDARCAPCLFSTNHDAFAILVNSTDVDLQLLNQVRAEYPFPESI